MAGPFAVADTCGDSVQLKPKAQGLACMVSQLRFREGKWCFLVALMFICSQVSSGWLWVFQVMDLQRQLCEVRFLLHCFKTLAIMVPAQGSL